ncbi:hypothetical protein H4R33_006028 [Dimargaris cristalligena]|nr:hypothetical protein H4R33_006028 [Dimargaris cristalligena]
MSAGQIVDPAAVFAFYRRAIRAVRTFPVEILREKTLYNFRDGINMYRMVDSPDRIKRLIERGQKNIEWLESWQSLSPERIKQIESMLLDNKNKPT